MIACLLVGLLGPAAPVAAQDEVQIKTLPLRDGVYMLAGKGGNIGLFIGEDGTFLIDDQFAPLTVKHLAAIRAVGGDVPKFLINTHYHADHTGGNENLGNAGALIFSHDNVRERLTVETVIEAFNMVTPPLPKAALPVVTFSTDVTFHLNGDTLRAYHVPRAHTDGDSVIHFKNANVIHTGEAADGILALADGDTLLIAGHGPIGDKAQLQAYRDMLATAYQRLRALRAKGMSAGEAVAQRPLDDLEERWGKGLFPGEKWIGLIYDGLD
jgi:glyoxylase-like metal-dependent hydrolase (beta-lactamase superfamily II)